MRPLRHLCVMWPRLVAYHHARLAVLQDHLTHRSARLTALETVRRDALPAWDSPRRTVPYPTETLFPGPAYDSISAAAMHRAVTEALDRLDPDAVAITSYSTPDARAALAWCRRRRRVAVMMFDSRREDAPRSVLREWPKRQLVRLFDAALVGGRPHVGYAVELGVPRSHVFTPVDVVDNAYFAAEADAARSAGGSPPGLSVEAPYFLFVGRLAEVKNLPTLLEAYALYRRHATSPWPLVLVGDGAERDALAAAAGPGVVFAGARALGELPQFYGRAGAFVLPSWKDTWGLVVNEAMAAGLPVLVSTGAGCAPDLVEPGGNGWTFAPGDADGLAQILATVADQPAAARAALGARSREMVGNFGLDDFARGLWDAVQAGRSRSGRGLSLGGGFVLHMLRAVSRHPTSFHAIPD